MKNLFRGVFSAIATCCMLALLPTATAFAQDTIKPTLSITNIIKSGQLWSNDVFIVRGKAADNVGVSNVVCSLNQVVLTNAVTANGWTNWSAELDLIPGTNTIAAYAVDLSGNRSATNTTKLVYYLTTVLTVRTNGTGKISLSPAYNGARLQIGANYSMTANSSIIGYGLVNWTDASNNVVTNTATLKFTMASNLTFTANYGDIGKPTIRVTNTYTNDVLNSIVVGGTATDNIAVTNVLCRMNTGLWQAATTTNHWTNWTMTVTNLPGLNTFYYYAVDTSSNTSPVWQIRLVNYTAPVGLSGLQATVAPNNTAAFQVAFGTKTFSQLASQGDTNNVNGVGTYTYLIGADGVSAAMNLKYTGPPSAIPEGSQTIGLYFTDRRTAYLTLTNIVATNILVVTTNNSIVSTNPVATNVVVTIHGFMYFSPAPPFAQKSIANQMLVSAGRGAGSGYGTRFQKGTFASYPLLTSGTNTGTYTYALYSPLSALFKLTSTNSTDYIIATYGGTNYGGFYSEEYTPAGVTNGTDIGRFVIASQKTGGNAPLALTNRNLQIFASDDDFNVQFGASTYSQDSSNTNYDNDVGDYSYALINTNISQLNLTVTEPPSLAGNTNAARLIFVAGNAGFFTNDDGTISTFAMTSVTNFALTSVDNHTFYITVNGSSSASQLSFTNGNQFALTVPGFFFSTTYTGTCNYSVFSPQGAMARLNFINDSTNSGIDWLQFKFASATNGSFFVNEFDSATNFQDSAPGTFQGN